MGLFDWIKDFKKHYKDHSVDFSVTDYGTRITIAIDLKDIPEDKARIIVEKLDNAIAQLSKGKLPLSPPPVKDKVKQIKMRIKGGHKSNNNPLITGVV